MTTILPDGSAFFIAEIDTSAPPLADPICWNPWNKVVQDHRDGTIDHERTHAARVQRGLVVPWTVAIGEVECRQPPID